MRNGIKRAIMVILITGVLAGVLTACGNRSENTETVQEEAMKGEYHKITAEEAKNRMDSDDTIIILDVRTQEEYEESHIPGAILIPKESIGTEKQEQLPDMDQEILVYCRSGNRSAQAAKKLVEAGYTQIYDFGGIMDWPYETESGIE
ncbi:MAG: rhodanese-like domain-containing protein [Eisenbergiella sp.]